MWVSAVQLRKGNTKSVMFGFIKDQLLFSVCKDHLDPTAVDAVLGTKVLWELDWPRSCF